MSMQHPVRPSAPNFEWRPLVEPVNPATVKAYGAQLRASGATNSPIFGNGSVGTIITLVIVAVFGFFVVTTMGTIFSIVLSSFAGTGGGIFGVLASVVPFLLVGGAITAFVFFAIRSHRGNLERRYRLDTFSRANGMTYEASISQPPLPGMIFGLGSSRSASDIVRGQVPRFVEFANYQFTTGSGKSRSTHKWGYVAIHLDTPLPHIVLDAMGNNGMFGSNLPLAFQKDQRLSLEGNFDQYFSLYCPTGYEVDALYLFTPDIMARFIDNAAQLDVEIVDDWLFFYAKRDLSTLDPATWAWLFATVQAMLGKLEQWARWRDDRLAAIARPVAPALPGAVPDAVTGAVPDAPGTESAAAFAAPEMLRPPPGVAPQGRRLTKGVRWWSVLLAVGIVFYFFAQIGFGFLGALFR